MGRLAQLCGWLLLSALALSNPSCSDDLTPAEIRAACERDPTSMCCGSGDCAQGWACDFSAVCGQGSDHQVTCNRATGDRQCHALCDANTVCASGQMCQQVSLFDTTDAGHAVSFCKASP